MTVSTIAIPIYIGEWNHVDREKKSPANTDDISQIDAIKIDLTQEEDGHFGIGIMLIHLHKILI